MKKQLIGLAITFFILTGCDKESEMLYPDPLFPAQEIFKAPLFIEVVTTEGLRVSNAKINLGTTEAYTDASGLCYMTDAMVAKSSYLIVEKEGYFHASRRFYPSEGSAHYLKIVLLSNSRIAFFNTKDGAILPVEDHATIRFPAEGYILANGKTYDGIVVVSAKTIAADDLHLSFKMPGDLVGINGDGKFGALGSLGMIAVEMKTPDGDKLEFADGAQATLEMIIPSSMTDKAPSSIPLWYFDEVEGIWKEEGIATKSGDRYIGSVNHFSFWNCDAWFETISWGASFTYEDGSPASQVKVCITIESLSAANCAYTDSDGVVQGMVAANEVLHLEVYGRCGQEIFASDIGPYTYEYFYGPVSLSDPTAQSQVSGYAYDCDLKPLVNGYVKISTGSESYYTVPDAQTGAFKAVVSGCVQGLVYAFAFNPNESYSKIFSAPFASHVEIDTLSTCRDLEEYALIQIEGFANPIYFDSLELRTDVDYTSIRAYGIGENILGIWFQGVSVGSYYPVYRDTISFYGYADAIQFKNEGPLLITIDSYGEIGELVSGRIQGKVTTSEYNYIPEYMMTGSFSVRRE
jgi:hypothetical protein